MHVSCKHPVLTLSSLCAVWRRIKEDHVIQHGLVVDGASLSLALREHEKLFMEVCKNCSAVLCCRMAPLQKAKVETHCYSSRCKENFIKPTLDLNITLFFVGGTTF